MPADPQRFDEMKIRVFAPGDEHAVVALWQECGLTRPWNDPRADIARKLTEQPEGFLVGLVGSDLVATAMVGFDGHRGWLYYLAVAPAHRRQSLGRALMQKAECLLVERGCPKLNLMVRASNPAAIEFYRALGYAQDEVVNLGKRLIPDDSLWRRHHTEAAMNIEQFMQGYKAAWEARDETLFCALFTPDGAYHNTPFAVQRGHAQLAAYWQRVKLQEDVDVSYEILAATHDGGVAHWRVTYQVASEELFRIWAASTGTNLIGRKPGEALPRMVLDGVLQASFNGGLCTECRLWWHSSPVAG